MRDLELSRKLKSSSLEDGFQMKSHETGHGSLHESDMLFAESGSGSSGSGLNPGDLQLANGNERSDEENMEDICKTVCLPCKRVLDNTRSIYCIICLEIDCSQYF